VAIPDRFFNDLTIIGTAIMVFNYSGQALWVVLDEKKCDGEKRLTDAREDDVELNGFFLGRGKCVGIPQYPHYYIVSVRAFAIGEDGIRQYWDSRIGFKLTKIEGKTITIVEGKPRGTISYKLSSYQGTNFCIVVNKVGRPLHVEIEKPKDSGPDEGQEQDQQRIDRGPDGGGIVVQEITVEEDGEWHFRNPPDVVEVRFLQKRFMEYNRHHVASDASVPSQSNYIELAKTEATTGTYAGAFKVDGSVGSIEAKTYDAKDIKPVNSRIALRGRNNV